MARISARCFPELELSLRGRISDELQKNPGSGARRITREQSERLARELVRDSIHGMLGPLRGLYVPPEKDEELARIMRFAESELGKPGFLTRNKVKIIALRALLAYHEKNASKRT